MVKTQDGVQNSPNHSKSRINSLGFKWLIPYGVHLFCFQMLRLLDFRSYLKSEPFVNQPPVNHLKPRHIRILDPQFIKLATSYQQDRLLFYLRIVHSVDYYNHSEYPNEDEMPNRCGIMHARAPTQVNNLVKQIPIGVSHVQYCMRPLHKDY